MKGSELEQETQDKAVEKLTAAANANNNLSDKVRRSATETLKSLLRELGYKSVEVTFDKSLNEGT